VLCTNAGMPERDEMGRVYSVHEGEKFGLGNVAQNRLKRMTWLYFNLMYGL
jgi:hypothetical protein